VKKVLGILAIMVGALIAFGVVSKRAEANKAVFNTGSQDEREFAKQKSLDFLRGRSAGRSTACLTTPSISPREHGRHI